MEHLPPRRRLSQVTRTAVVVLLCWLAVAIAADEPQGEVRVMLLFTQSASPQMLNGIRADIGLTEPVEEIWIRGSSFSKKLKIDNYTVAATNAEVCVFNECYPCPPQTRSIRVDADRTIEVVFRWKARWDRVEKKWNCT